MAKTPRFWWMPDGWRILVFDDRAEIDDYLASDLSRRAHAGEVKRVALASGATFAGFFATLKGRAGPNAAWLDGVIFHHLDELDGLEPFSKGSLSGEIRDAGFPGRLVPVYTRWGSDPVAAHEKNLAGCDLVLLGIGRNGHLAFNEPGTPLASRSHVATLAPETREAHAAAFGGRPVPEQALTAGIQTILSARELVVVATGAAKAGPVAAALSGTLSPDCPASAIRLHDRVTVLLDQPAAQALRPITAMRPPGRTMVLDRASWERPAPATALVVAPHPDDASISCGGLLALLGDRATRHIATFSTGARAITGASAADAAALRENESLEEGRILGASVSFLRARAYDSGVFEPADADALLAVLDRVRPDDVLVPAREDPHPTHRLCRLTAEAAIEAHLRRGARSLDVWTFEGPWFHLAREAINTIVKLDREAHEKKQAGIRAHRSQVSRVPFDAGAAAMERLRAIEFAESHLGRRAGSAFDHDTKVECYRRVILNAPGGAA